MTVSRISEEKALKKMSSYQLIVLTNHPAGAK